jgi:(1->4)-alpha-D-glucan 1-alpha-D-glucosylmutase
VACALLFVPAMRIPIATYRLQLTPRQGFEHAAALTGYLADLGISDVYASPVFKARPGSEHGYDVIDHGELNPELGGAAGFERLAAALRKHDLGLVLDIVPNHMCIAGDSNWRWLDVLENGPSSPAARFFDIDWRPPKSELYGRVLLPVLPKQYGEALESDLRVVFEEGCFSLRYNGTRLPLDTSTWGHLLEPALSHLRRGFGDEAPDLLELESVLRAIRHLPSRTDVEPARVRERTHEREVIRRRLAALMDHSPQVNGAVAASLREINGRPGDHASFDGLEALLAVQGYRLSLWRVAAHEINYRRFFDINELAAIRVEDPLVFAAVHELPLRLAAQRVVTGFRIDHVDGLSDPEQYLSDLRRAWAEAAGEEPEDGGGYVVVEKILAPNERLPSEWSCSGTTGYEFLNMVAGVLVNGAASDQLKGIAHRFTEESKRFQDVVYEGKKLILRAAMSAELTVLARKLDRISEQHRYSRDFTLNSLHEVLSEIIACFPIYRTYARAREGYVGDRDRGAIETAIRAAKRRNPVINESLFDFVRSLLLLEHPEGLTESQLEAHRDFARRFQQLTGPVTAKGVEDTAFYRYFPLAALCEVGGDPSRIGMPLEELHRRNVERMRSFPHGMSATATHDTKRGEDTRARLFVLSEVPERWEAALERWRALNQGHRVDMGGWEAPDPRDELLLYQTLVGTLPPDGVEAPGYRERILAYMEKATHEAKVHTSWVNPNTAYVGAVARFIERILDPGDSGAFIADLRDFVADVAWPGYWNGLTQLMLKLTAPGVPDIYQGTELWDFSLVDPDNRRPVDFAQRRSLLGQLMPHPERPIGPLLDELTHRPEDGRVKMLVMQRGLSFRRSQRALFEQGRYEPLAASGGRADNVIAFARARGDAAAVVVCGRLFAGLGGRGKPPVGEVWRDTRLLLPETLAGRRFRDAISGEPIEATPGGGPPALALSRVFARLPVALLESLGD